MVFEHLQDFLNLKDLMNGFIQLHQHGSHVVVSYIPWFIAQILSAIKLALAKPSGGIRLIIVGEAFLSIYE
jgi:hypothetical protein